MRPTLRVGARGPDVTFLQSHLSDAGLELVIDGDFGPKTAAAVREFQLIADLAVDGVVGPLTWAALLAVEDDAPPPPAIDRLARAGEVAVEEARRLWGLNIYDPPNSARAHEPSRAQIDRMIRSEHGLGWTWQKPYVMDNDYQWCGAFAATCWAVAGLPLKPHRFSFFSSAYRLDLWGKYAAFEQVSSGTRPAKDGRMMIKLDEQSRAAECVMPDGTLPRAGDVVLVGTGTPDEGSHITICESYDAAAGVFTTLEGNAGSRRSGLGPQGDNRQGVIRARRTVGGAGYHVRRVIRPGSSDLA